MDHDFERRRIRSTAAALIGGLAAAAAAIAYADSSLRRLDDDRVLITSFSGKPPFERRIVAVDALHAAERARLDDAERASVGGAERTAAGYRAHPPFRRPASGTAADETARFARFEESPAESAAPVRRGPPGKPFSSR